MSGPVGIVGLGLLGSAVAGRLIESGRTMVGYDLDPERVREFAAAGGRSAASPRDVAAAAGTILLVLPDAAVASSVLQELELLAPGATILDLTTGDPDVMKAAGERLHAAGVDYVDATVGGSSDQARKGDVIVMAGGAAEAVERCRPLLAAFARETFHVGSWGSGARMKLALNLVLGLNRAALAEGLAFAHASGLSMDAALSVFRAGPAWSRVMDVKGRRMIDRDFRLAARLSQHRKDVDLILEAASRNGAHTPLSSLHRQLLVDLERQGFGGEDNSAVVRAFLSR